MYLDGFARHFSSRYTPSDPKFIILDPQNIKKLGLGFRVGERARGGPEEAGIEKVDRRLQPNAKVPFTFSILRSVFEGRYHELSFFTANNHGR